MEGDFSQVILDDAKFTQIQNLPLLFPMLRLRECCLIKY